MKIEKFEEGELVESQGSRISGMETAV